MTSSVEKGPGLHAIVEFYTTISMLLTPIHYSLLTYPSKVCVLIISLLVIFLFGGTQKSIINHGSGLY